MKKNFFSIIISLLMIISAMFGGTFFCLSAFAEQIVSVEDVRFVADGIIEWKKADVGSVDGYLINDKFLEQAGTTPGDWFPIGLGRLGIADNQDGYLAVINENVQNRYDTPKRLDKAKATEWHRISLAILASGGNPRAVGEDRDGDGRNDIDLIADGTYNRVDDKGNGMLARQGLNGFIWGLIALDSMYYEVPEDAFYSRDDIIMNILSKQLADGGWALSGSVSDPDITAMTIQAFVPYYNSEKVYTYQNKNLSKTENISKKVRTAVDEAVEMLSDMQQKDGDYYSWGMLNCESTVQVAVALCSLGIDIFNDERFIKLGDDGLYNTLYDGIMKYRTSEGGFAHSFVNDVENPSAVAGKSNTMASEQTLYGMVAIIRLMTEQRRLYDFRQEQNEQLKQQIKDVSNQIDTLTSISSIADITVTYQNYLAIDSAERSYVYNYYKLSKLIEIAGIKFEDEDIDYNSGDAGAIVPIQEFTDVDKTIVDNLPEVLTTRERTEILRLWNIIQNCFDFKEKQSYYVKIEKAKNEIEALKIKIEDIKADIKKFLYPFNNINLKDRKIIHELYNRFDVLSEYDKTQFEPSDIEGLLKSKTQVDNLLTALIIGVSLSVVVVGIFVFIVLRISKRKKIKLANQLEESDE